jgi:hypothetical protein
MNVLDLTDTENTNPVKEIFATPKQLLKAFRPTSDDKRNMKFLAKTIFAIVQAIEGGNVSLRRKHIAAFAQRCVPEVLCELLNVQALVTVLYKCIRDKFLPLKDLLYSCVEEPTAEVDEELFNCFTYEKVDQGYRCNHNGKLVFTIEEALQWFLTRGLVSPDGTQVTSLQKVKRKGTKNHFPSLLLQLFITIHPDFDQELRADLFYCKHTYDLERCLDFRFELHQDWQQAEDDVVNRQQIIDELQTFADEWSIDIPSLHMMKSIMANPSTPEETVLDTDDEYSEYILGGPVEGFTVEQIFANQTQPN